MNFNQSKRVCWKACVKMCVANIPLIENEINFFNFLRSNTSLEQV